MQRGRLAGLEHRLWANLGLLGRAAVVLSALVLLVSIAGSFVLVGLSVERSAVAQSDAVHNEMALESAYSESVQTTDLALQGFLRTAEPSFLDDYDSNHVALDDSLAALRLHLPAALAPQLRALIAAQAGWDGWARQARINLVDGDATPSPELAASSLPTYQALQSAAADLERASDLRFGRALAAEDRGVATATAATVIGCLIGFAGLAVLTWGFYTTTILPLRRLISAADRLSSGEQLAVPELKVGGEVGRLAGALTNWAATMGERQEMADRMSELVDELRLANTELATASRHKGEFLATMSHELRTPLNSILGFAQLLQVGDFGGLTSRQARYVENILASGTHLLSLINDVLDLTKVESGHIALHSETVSIADAFDQSLAKLRPLAEAKGIEVQAFAGPRLAVRADARRLQQVLLNLLSNAIKFTAEGGLVRLEAGAAGAGVAVTVTDTGVGIPDDQLDTIFERFVQLGAGRTRIQEGTGLGLSLSRNLVELMGGTLAVRSRLGEGSSFTLTLPGARLMPRTSPAPATAAS